MGYGLGLGGNASTLLGATIAGAVPLSIAETDWARHIVDLGPLFGLLFIALRVLLVGWLAGEAWRALRRGASVLPALLFGFASIELLYGQITGQGTVNAYAWLFAGFCVAAGAEHPSESEPAMRESTGPAVRFPNILR